MKELDITSFLTPQILEFVSANPDILNIIFSGTKNNDSQYAEELEALKTRLVKLEKELTELKTIITKNDLNKFKHTGNRKFPL